jgi:hypothetical protein
MSQSTEQKQSTYLPPELWQRVFFQHADPKELWTAGRQVCSIWRSEIPKIFAKKYLENQDMVQIYFDLGCERIEGSNCFMAAEMVFNRYEGEGNKRCVFAEHTLTNGSARREPDEFSQKYERRKTLLWRDGLSMYLGSDVGAREDGGRFDLPSYQIRIKSRARDSELPRLAFDFDKREISFEWERMFTQFFLESTMLANLESEIMTESVQWLKEAGDRTISGALAHSKRRGEVMRDAARNVRRHRIKKFYKDNHNWEYKDSSFWIEEKDKALDAIKDFKLRGDFTRCAEDTESKERARAHAESQDMFDVLHMMRGVKGVREDDENGLMAMLMQLMGAGDPSRRQADEDEEDDDEDDEDDDGYYDEDDDDASEEEYVLQDEWTDWTPNGNE